jgi:hypothetical protein
MTVHLLDFAGAQPVAPLAGETGTETLPDPTLAMVAQAVIDALTRKFTAWRDEVLPT